MELQTMRDGYAPGPGHGLAGIWVAATPELERPQAEVIAAAALFMLAAGSTHSPTALVTRASTRR